MEVFWMSAEQMLILALFMIAGFALVRAKLAPENTGTVLSKLEAFLFVPCLQFGTFWKNCTVENFRAQWKLILYGAIAAAVYGVIAVFVAKLIDKDHYHQKLLNYAFTTSNYGYIGNAVVLGMFGEDVFFSYLMFTLPFTVYTYSIGVPGMMPNKGTFGSRMKNLLNPCLLSELLGLACGLLSLKLPDFLSDAISISGSCMSPVALILTGAVIATFELRNLFNLPRTWIACGYRLLVLPIATALVCRLVRADELTTMMAVCFSSMPVGLNSVIFPAAYGKETRFGASMVLISNCFALITIPILFRLFVPMPA